MAKKDFCRSEEVETKKSIQIKIKMFQEIKNLSESLAKLLASFFFPLRIPDKVTDLFSYGSGHLFNE